MDKNWPLLGLNMALVLLFIIMFTLIIYERTEEQQPVSCPTPVINCECKQESCPTPENITMGECERKIIQGRAFENSIKRALQ